MFWSKKIEKYSLENLQQLYSKLQSIKEVNSVNQAQVIEILRMISELMIWGDQHNPLFFEFFVNNSILATYVDYIRGSNKEVQVQVIQALGILIANTKSQEVTFYLLSNNHINQLISFPFDFKDTEELTAYYISFLKTLSNKLSLATIDFFFNQSTGEFPLFSEALKLASNRDAMVRIAVRTLSLNVFRLDHPPLRNYLIEHAIQPFFANVALFLAVQFNEMNCALASISPDHRSHLDELVEAHSDWLHYLQDVIDLRVSAFSSVLLDCLLHQYLLAVLLPLLSADLRDPTLFASVSLALFLLAQVFVTLDDATLLNSLAKHLNRACRLLTHPDERVVYYSMVLVLAVVKCPVDKDVLRRTGLLSNDPMNFKKDTETDDAEHKRANSSIWESVGTITPSSTPRSISLLSETPILESLILNPGGDDLDSCVIHTDSSFSQASTTAPPSTITSTSDESASTPTAATTTSLPAATTPLPAAMSTPTTTITASPTPATATTLTTATTITTGTSDTPFPTKAPALSSATITSIVTSIGTNSPSGYFDSHPCITPVHSVSLDTLVKSNCPSQPAYSHLVIGSLLQLLVRMDSIQLGTLQLMCELARELTNGAVRPCMPPEHLNLIRLEVGELLEFLHEQLQQTSSFDRTLDLVEDEVVLLGSFSADLSQHKNLLPAPLTEGQLRRSVQQYMCTRKLLRDMTLASPSPDPLLALLRQSNSVVRGSCIDMDKDMKVIPCTFVQDNLNIFVLLHPDLLLLVKKHSDPKLVSQSVVELAVPLKHQEAQQSPNNSSILLLKLKAEKCPHPTCQKLLGATAAERERTSWSMSLVFTHPRHCIALVRHLKEARDRTRQATLEDMTPLLALDNS